jgi:hypothetical protein
MLEISPDLDARLCYGIVLLCALISARIQVYGRLSGLKERAIYAWSLPSTWGVFLTYVAIPLGLFWFLDRTGAVRDTSFFAALLVGLAYPSVISGGAGVKQVQGVAGVLGWLDKATDSLITKIVEYVSIDAHRFQKKVTDGMSDPAFHAAVAAVAQEYGDTVAMDQELAAESDPDKKDLILYDYATQSAFGLRPLTEELSKFGLKKSESPYFRAKFALWCWLVPQVALVVAIGWLCFSRAGEERFELWRLTKPGISQNDLNRARNRLSHFLAEGGTDADRMRAKLATALDWPGLEVQRADEIIRLLLQYRGTKDSLSFRLTAQVLTNSLRVSSVDVRARVQHALLLLAKEASADETSPTIPEALGKWQPLATDSPIDLEEIWRAWDGWWTQTLAKAK